MKKLVKALAILMLATAAAFAARCTPEDDPNNGGNNNSNAEALQHYSISVSASPTEGGTVSGGGNLEEDQSCTVTATPATNYTFHDWTEDGIQVSTNPHYTFTVTRNRNLEANFMENGGDDPLPYHTIHLSANPTEGGLTTGNGSYQEGQTCTVTARPNNLYTFTNWTENGHIVSDSATYTFTVTSNRNLEANFAMMDANTVVDLGLPSGTLWAACNIGANTPTEYGDYFAWGETQAKSYFGCDNYQHCNGCEYNENFNLITITKYCSNPAFGYNGFMDDQMILLPEDDAATAILGEDWRLPTKEEWDELLQNTTVKFTNANGTDGLLLTASNGACIFLPAGGFLTEDILWYPGFFGNYWASSLYKDEPDSSWDLAFTSDLNYVSKSYRFCGRSVRAVRCTSNLLSLQPNSR